MEQNNNQIAVRAAQKTAVTIRREMVKIPAVMGALGPVEKAVFLASTDKTIAECESAELAAELATALKWIWKDVGYRCTDESDRQYLIIRTAEILKRYYGGLSLKDFRMAFEMGITGELDEFLPKGRDGQADRNHYQQFNVEYVCKILNAYQGRRARVLKKAQQATPEVEPQPDPERSKYYRNATRQDCINAYLHYKYRGWLPLNSIGEMLCYNVLVEAGLADEIEITLDEQRIILQRAINELTSRGMAADARRLKGEGVGAKGLEYRTYSLARRNALKRTFDAMIRAEVQITDYIKLEK